MQIIWLALLLAPAAQAARFRNATATSATAAKCEFQKWYTAHDKGRGIWKWSNSLDAYQQHLESFTGQELSLMEVGVQSGGSIKMWQENLGNKCHYYGVDIDKRCLSFDDKITKITLGDQGKAETWTNFFEKVVPEGLNVAVDDGGHLPKQMLVTLQQVWPHMLKGGVYSVEDIHGQNDDYFAKFFSPAADFLAARGEEVTSVHIYPFMLVARKAGAAELKHEAPVATYDTVVELMNKLPEHKGKTVALENKKWDSMLAADGLKTLFKNFYDLHGSTVQQVPKDCYMACKEKPCTFLVPNNKQQALILAVHITAKQVLVEVAGKPPTIDAVRKGVEWHENMCDKAPKHQNSEDYEGYR